MSVPWITLTVTALNDAKAATLISAVQTTSLASGQGDPIPALISQIVEELRGAIGFSGKYGVSETEGTIPPNLKDMAVQKIVRICKRRLEQTLNQDDRDDEASYQKRLDYIRRGEWPIDQPDDPLATAPSTPNGKVSEVRAPARRFTRAQLDNL
jgi:hypothetical protein